MYIFGDFGFVVVLFDNVVASEVCGVLYGGTHEGSFFVFGFGFVVLLFENLGPSKVGQFLFWGFAFAVILFEHFVPSKVGESLHGVIHAGQVLFCSVLGVLLSCLKMWAQYERASDDHERVLPPTQGYLGQLALGTGTSAGRERQASE